MIYYIPVFWTCTATLEVEADSLDEAIDVAEETPLPEDRQYLPDSFEINWPVVESMYQ